jgi:2-methylisocitrate lyase-like PEP mutase family enzyme
MSRNSTLRTLLEGPEIIIAPGATDAYVARIIERVGFPAVYVTGAGISNTLGFPDLGLTTMTEIVARARSIADAVKAPLISDADTGYGNPINVMRTVKEFEAAGKVEVDYTSSLRPSRIIEKPSARSVVASGYIKEVKELVESGTLKTVVCGRDWNAITLDSIERMEKKIFLLKNLRQ